MMMRTNKSSVTNNKNSNNGEGGNSSSSSSARVQWRSSLVIAILLAWMIFSALYMMTMASNVATLTYPPQQTSTITSIIGDANQATIISTNSQQQQQQQRASTVSSLFAAAAQPIPLPQLVETDNFTPCPPPLVRYNDTILDARLAYSNIVNNDNDDQSNNNIKPQWHIPRILHFTSKSRCVLPQFIKFLGAWQFANYSVFFHDDDAVDRLLYDKFWPEFPDVHHVLDCTLSGASKVDLWRAVVLYEYGGVYTDIDNLPNKFNGHADNFGRNTNYSIAPDDEAFFVVEQLGVMSQYFMASQPKHPLMYLLVKQTMNGLLQLPNVKAQYAPQLTGPGALKRAMIEFMNLQHKQDNKIKDDYAKFQRVAAGKYRGFLNATVTVVGTKENSEEWVLRDKIGRQFGGVRKAAAYGAMNMTHFSKAPRLGPEESCVHRIYRQVILKQYQQRQQQQQQQAMLQQSTTATNAAAAAAAASWWRPLW